MVESPMSEPEDSKDKKLAEKDEKSAESVAKKDDSVRDKNPEKACRKQMCRTDMALAAAMIIVVLLIALCLQIISTRDHKTVAKRFCGDGVCNREENCSCNDCKCPTGQECEDDRCTDTNSCGNQACDANENCSSCASDCGACGRGVNETYSKSQNNPDSYCANSTCSAAPSYCGDGSCNANETQVSCKKDCGEPLADGVKCAQNGDCLSGNCINNICSTTGPGIQRVEPSGYAVSWSPLKGEGFWQLYPGGDDSPSRSNDGPYAPGGLYGQDVKFINGAPVRYNYWQDYATKHCLEHASGMSPQDIRAAAKNPALNCERLKNSSTGL